ncbi:ATP-binding protein [Cupriavidus basilensis]
MSLPAPSKAERPAWVARHDSMFIRLFLVMAAIMLAVHLLGVTVIESIFPHPGHSGFTLVPGDEPPPPPPGEPGRGGVPRPAPKRARAAAKAVRRRHAGRAAAVALASRLAQDVHAPPLDEDSGPAEARDAAKAFNHMQQRIRTQLAQQSRFLAAVSHDLRTPLTRMSLRIEGVDDNQVRYRLRQDLAEMNGLIDATLYYLRERDGAAAPRQRVDVHALLQAVVDDATEIGQDVSLSGGAEPLLAYPAELRRAVVNLVENAHRYGGSARIALADSAERVVIDVCDDGPGIPPEEMARVLEPFYRLESSRNRATGGVGMGLSIAADIVSRHGGELSLANRPEGGLRVRIVLPRA